MLYNKIKGKGKKKKDKHIQSSINKYKSFFNH